eukprot:2754721-Rhodomonas_salina.1
MPMKLQGRIARQEMPMKNPRKLPPVPGYPGTRVPGVPGFSIRKTKSSWDTKPSQFSATPLSSTDTG